MDNDQVQGNQIDQTNTASQLPAEQVNQPEPTPSSDQTQTEGTEPNEEALALENSKNPERTKSYIDKLKRELEEARSVKPTQSSVDYGSSVFDSFRPAVNEVSESVLPQPTQFLNPNQVNSIQSQFVDQEGNVDINGLNRALNEANQTAYQAQQQAQKAQQTIERYEETQQVREAHEAFKWLDPKNKEFDPQKFELVRDRLLREKYYGGKNITLFDAARTIEEAIGGRSNPPMNVDQLKSEAVAQFKQAQTVKQQQGPVEQGRGESRVSEVDNQELRERTRKGDQAAIRQRLINAGIIKPD